MPDRILVSGDYARDLLESGGTPSDRIAVVGNRRFPPLKKQEPSATKGNDVLVILPIGELHTKHLLAALARAYQEGGADFSFIIQPHPAA